MTALATFLHDAGKPRTAGKNGEKVTFYRHEMVGEEIAEAICRRLKMSRKDADSVAWLVRRHMTFKDAAKMRESKLKRLFAEENFDRLMALSRADALASTGDLADYDYCLRRKAELSVEEIAPQPFLSGHDLIAMGLAPGPIFRELLDAAYEEQLEGSVRDKEEALEYVKKLLREKGK